MLSADDDLPHRPRRVLVAGVAASGKTTLAVQVADALALPRVELDALHHGPAWVPREEFATDVETFSATDAWVSEWQYGPVRELLASRADLLIWLDLPTPLTITRVVRRTVRRRLRREVLWNGNIEPPLWTFFTDREHIVRWAWSTRHTYRHLVPALVTSHPDLTIICLRSRADVDRWTDRLRGGVA